MQICKFQLTLFAQVVISVSSRVILRLWYLGKFSLGLKNSKCPSAYHEMSNFIKKIRNPYISQKHLCFYVP